MKRTIMQWLFTLAPPDNVDEFERWIVCLDKIRLANNKCEKRLVESTCRGCGMIRKVSIKSHSKNGMCIRCQQIYSRISSRASTLLNRAVKKGIIPHIKTRECKDCGAQAKHYDHRDYRKPLLVDPVCISCNQKRGPAEPFRSLLKIGKPYSKAEVK